MAEQRTIEQILVFETVEEAELEDRRWAQHNVQCWKEFNEAVDANPVRAKTDLKGYQRSIHDKLKQKYYYVVELAAFPEGFCFWNHYFGEYNNKRGICENIPSLAQRITEVMGKRKKLDRTSYPIIEPVLFTVRDQHDRNESFEFSRLCFINTIVCSNRNISYVRTENLKRKIALKFPNDRFKSEDEFERDCRKYAMCLNEVPSDELRSLYQQEREEFERLFFGR